MKVCIALLGLVLTSGPVSSLDLISAAQSQSHEKVLALLKDGAAVDSVDDIGETALHHACQKKSPQIVTTLLEAGANPNIQDMYGYTPLFFATESVDLRLVDLLLDAGADPNLRNRDGVGPLYKATQAGVRPLVRRLLAAGADSRAKGTETNSPLELAAEGTDRDMFLLLRDGLPHHEILFWDGVRTVEVDLKSEDSAPVKGRIRNAFGVVAEGIPATKTEGGGRKMAWDGRSRSGGPAPSGTYFFELPPFRPTGIRSSRTIIRTDGDPNAIVAAVQSGRASIVRQLLSQANIAGVDSSLADGRTPLMIAAEEGNLEVVNLLLDAGASPMQIDSNGKSALSYAMSQVNGKAIYDRMLEHMKETTIRR